MAKAFKCEKCNIFYEGESVNNKYHETRQSINNRSETKVHITIERNGSAAMDVCSACAIDLIKASLPNSKMIIQNGNEIQGAS